MLDKQSTICYTIIIPRENKTKEKRKRKMSILILLMLLIIQIISMTIILILSYKETKKIDEILKNVKEKEKEP